MTTGNEEKNVLDTILQKSGEDEVISSVIGSQTGEFPSVSEVNVLEPWSDPFAFPAWCNTKRYAFAWANIRDDIERHRVFEVEHFQLVTRSTSWCMKDKPKPLPRDFRNHGAVERQGMFLIYRPKNLDEKLRTYSVLRHAEMVSSVSAGKHEEGFEVTHDKSKEDKGGSGMEVYAYEEAGTHAPTAADLKPGDLQK